MSKEFRNVTKEWLINATPNSHEIIEDNRYYKDDNGIKYYVDSTNVIYSPNDEEKENAEWIRKTFGEKVRIQSKVNAPKYIRCPDYKWVPVNYEEEKWDLKTLGKDALSKTRAVDNSIKKAKGQSSNFIIKIDNECVLTNKDVIEQIEKIYKRNGREWVDKIIIRKGDKVIGVYIRK